MMTDKVTTFGPSERVRAFVEGLLKPATQERYKAALSLFDEYCSEEDVRFGELDEESQDFFLADFVLEQCENETMTLQGTIDLVAGLQKRFLGRRRYHATALVINGWKKGHPPDQAKPLPQEAAGAMFSLFWAAGMEALAMTVLLCFCGLLRVGEALQLRRSDVLLPCQHSLGRCVVLLLRTSKRGIPDGTKVVLWHPLVVIAAERYVLSSSSSGDRFLPLSYSTIATWLSRMSHALGFQ
jgi:hypothetical protein